MRKTLGIIALTGIALTLSACSSQQSAQSCTPVVHPGDATAAITVSGETFSKPKVTFPEPLKASKTETSFIGGDTSDLVQADDSVSIEATLLDGATGKVLSQTGYTGSNIPIVDLSSSSLASLSDALTCAPVGSRVVSVLTGDETLAKNLGLSADATIVGIFDVKQKYLSKANGEPQVVPDGFPAVVLDSNGVPGVTIPKTAAPTTTKVAVLKKGSGATVSENSVVTVQYAGYVWADNTLFQSTWETHQPASFDVNGVIPGFKQGLVGQKVGSQVLIVIPPAEGYGDQAQGSIPANSTLVFVVDILGVE